MARSRRTYNNWLIFLVIGAGALLFSTGRLTSPNSNSFPLLPESAEIEALVYGDLVVRAEADGARSSPALSEPRLNALLAAWRSARLVPVGEPQPVPDSPIQVDVYLDDGSAPQTALLYPQHAAVKMLGQSQWWRLVNQEMQHLLPPDSTAAPESK
ncbi:hypothetical protein KUW04_16510 [Halomonas denitrificans]|nr:hypothetical protein [Halomonas denitrificans]